MKPAALFAVLALIISFPAGAQSRGAVAATVNDETITVEDWIARMERMRFQDFVVRLNPLAAKTSTAGQIALESLINAKVIMQYAKKVELLPKDAEVDAEVERSKKLPTVIKALQEGQFTEAQLREDLRLQRTFMNVVTVNQRVTPEEMQAYYMRRTDLHGVPEQWRLSIIRVSSKAAADAVAAQLKKGAPFEKVAADLSDDPSTKLRGGDLGMIPANSTQLPAFIKTAVARIKPGEVTPPVTNPGPNGSTFTFFVKLVQRIEAKPQDMAAIRDQIERGALLEKVGGGNKKMTEVRKEMKINILLPGYQDLFTRLEKQQEEAEKAAGGK